MRSRLCFGRRLFRRGIEINSHMCSLSGNPEFGQEWDVVGRLDIWQILSRSCSRPQHTMLSTLDSGKCGRSWVLMVCRCSARSSSH